MIFPLQSSPSILQFVLGLGGERGNGHMHKKLQKPMELFSPTRPQRRKRVASDRLLPGNDSSHSEETLHVSRVCIQFPAKPLTEKPLFGITDENLWKLGSLCGSKLLLKYELTPGNITADKIDQALAECEPTRLPMYVNQDQTALTTICSKETERKLGKLTPLSLKAALSEFGIDLVEEAVEKLIAWRVENAFPDKG